MLDRDLIEHRAHERLVTGQAWEDFCDTLKVVADKVDGDLYFSFVRLFVVCKILESRVHETGYACTRCFRLFCDTTNFGNRRSARGHMSEARAPQRSHSRHASRFGNPLDRVAGRDASLEIGRADQHLGDG